MPLPILYIVILINFHMNVNIKSGVSCRIYRLYPFVLRIANYIGDFLSSWSQNFELCTDCLAYT